MRSGARWGAVLALAALPVLAGVAAAQDDVLREIRESQQRLEQIREERRQLQQQMQRLQSQVHDARTALANIEQQAAASTAVLRELDFQTESLNSFIEETTSQLLSTRDRLRARNVVLQQRLRGLYKRGPLHTVRVLLGAESFTDLLNRYKYLHLITSYDRALLEDVSQLEAELSTRERELAENLSHLQWLRRQQAEEVAQLRRIQGEQSQALRTYQARERQTGSRLDQLARDEARLTSMVAELERRRLEEERRRIAAGGAARESAITTRSLGALPWPVDGDLIYRFGPERRPTGIVLRWNGIGIAAAPGTPVRAVEAGTVAMAGPFEGYGPTVMLNHGGGYYTVYLYLDGLRVREGQQVATGDVLGGVGTNRGPEGNHIEFQVWGPVGSGSPVPVDPLDWLRRRAGR